MARRPGLSVRLKLTLSYTGFLMLAAFLVLAIVWAFLLRGNPVSWFESPLRWFQEPERIISNVLMLRGYGQATFMPATGIILAFLLVFGLVGGWFLAGRVLAPLSRITAATRQVGKGSLSHRIELEGRKDEFRELSDSFDAMLARLEAHVAAQQRFAANASHELRTPLAITRTLLEVASNDPVRGGHELDDRLRSVNERAIELTEALLLLSRTDQRNFTKEDVDLSLLAEEAVETLLPLAERRGVTIATAGELASLSGSSTLLLQLTTNLVHNAIVHNLPDHGTVTVTTESRPGVAVLTVENTGEPLSPQLVPSLTEPFRRGSARTHSDHDGVGLGLAIAESIASAHDGAVTLLPRSGGGLRVSVRLPVSAPTGSPY